jgi:hypothetical protein
VAEALAGRPPGCGVIVHSSNAAGAGRMAAALSGAGWRVRTVAPLGADWVAAHWARVAREMMASQTCG